MLDFLRKEFLFFENAGPTAQPTDFEALKQNKTFILSLGIFCRCSNDKLKKYLKITLKKHRGIY